LFVCDCTSQASKLTVALTGLEQDSLCHDKISRMVVLLSLVCILKNMSLILV